MFNSPLLALFGRSLREDSRSWITYAARLGLIAIILLFLWATKGTYGWESAPGLRFFSVVVYIQLFFIALAGLGHFASAITEEKEEMTLGLLRMTNLNAISILLGKGTSRLCGAMLMLLAPLPLVFLAISFGGISMKQILAAYAALGAFLFLLANLALLTSVMRQRTVTSSAHTGAILVGAFLVIPWLGSILRLPQQIGVVQSLSPVASTIVEISDWFSMASPFTRIGEILNTGFDEGPMCFQVWSNLGAGALFFVLAWLLFERYCHEQADAAPKRARFSLAKPLGILKAGSVWKLPLAWKDFHFTLGGKAWVLIKLLVYGVPTAMFVYFATHDYDGASVNWKNVGAFTVTISTMIASIEIAFIAASVFKQERRDQTLSSLVMLPYSIRQIAYQKVLGGIASMLPVFFYFCLGMLFVAEELFEEMGRWGRIEPLAIIVPSYLITQFLLFLHFTAWLSLYLKRGALPVAIALSFVGNMILTLTAGMLDREGGALAVLTITLLAITIALHRAIGTRLEELAAEE